MKKHDETIQDKMSRLTTLTQWFDSDEFVLEKAIDKFKEANALAEEIEKELTEVKNEIIVLKKSFEDKDSK